MMERFYLENKINILTVIMDIKKTNRKETTYNMKVFHKNYSFYIYDSSVKLEILANFSLCSRIFFTFRAPKRVTIGMKAQNAKLNIYIKNPEKGFRLSLFT